MSILRRILRRIFGRRDALAPEILRAIQVDDEHGVIKVNFDEIHDEDQAKLLESMTEKTGIPHFRGTVKHGWDLDRVQDPLRCPRCKKEAIPHYANFVYATQIAPRTMFAPAGVFCTQCPTVIINQDMIANGVANPRFKYQGVLGMSSHEDGSFIHFETWNGSTSVYLFDEDERPVGLVSKSDMKHYRDEEGPPPGRGPVKKPGIKKAQKAARRKQRARGKK